MGQIRITEPTRVYLSGIDETLLRSYLTYRDKRVEHEILRLKNPWSMQRFIQMSGGGEAGVQAYQEEMDRLKAERTKTLLLRDDRGLYTYSGLTGSLRDKFPSAEVTSDIQYPKPGLLAWKTDPGKNPRPYQLKIKENLLAARHGAVEVGTGLGKSFSLELLLKEIGLQATVMAPSTSIARQLYSEMALHFGQAKVGLYGDGRKDIGKLITVGIDDSLTRIEPGSKAWEFFSKAKVFAADESHLCPANSLLKVCMGLSAAAPYRFFFSGTQMRNDGLDLVLEGVIGPIVFRMTVQEGVDQGYLAKPVFRMIRMAAVSNDSPRDPNDFTRKHLFYNPKVNAAAAAIANQMVAAKRPVLILVDEVEQFSHLLPHLRFEAAFAHGPLTKKNSGLVPAQYQDSDPIDLVKRFNKGLVPILVGTSCISTGTDVQVNEATINLQGGQSEIQVRQGAIGRSTRGGEHGPVFNPWTGVRKTSCAVFDFDVMTAADAEGEGRASPTHRHAQARAAIYRDAYPGLETVSM